MDFSEVMMDAVYLHIKPRPIDLLQVLWYSQNTLSCITRVFEKESNAMLGYTDTVCSCYVNTSLHQVASVFSLSTGINTNAQFLNK